MERSEFIKRIATVRNRMSSITQAKVREILSLTEGMRYLGKNFTFDADADIDAQVNALLVALSDEMMQYTRKKAEEVADTDDDEIILASDVVNGKSTQERFDMHCSHLKLILESWIAIGFANKMSLGDIFFSWVTGGAKRNSGGRWLDAIRDGGYKATILKDGGTDFGRGENTDPIVGATLAGRYFITGAKNTSDIKRIKDSGAKGYYIYRGSNYDCPLCDGVCFDANGTRKLYTFDESIPIPVHPNCVCYAVEAE